MKQTLKSGIFEKRKALSKEDVKEKSEKIKENLYSLPEFKTAKNILLDFSLSKIITKKSLNILRDFLIFIF